jgi:hypothetical protein
MLQSAQKLRAENSFSEIAANATWLANARTNLGVVASSGGTLTGPKVDLIEDTSGAGRIVLNATAKTIVDGSATSLFDVACASGAICGGKIDYSVLASDGTDFQSLTGIVTYAAVNKAATLTLTITEVAANQAKAVSSGTLTLAWTFVTGTAKGTVKLTPTGSLTETVYTIVYTVYPLRGAVTIL